MHISRTVAGQRTTDDDQHWTELKPIALKSADEEHRNTHFSLTLLPFLLLNFESFTDIDKGSVRLLAFLLLLFLHLEVSRWLKNFNTFSWAQLSTNLADLAPLSLRTGFSFLPLLLQAIIRLPNPHTLAQRSIHPSTQHLRTSKQAG